MAFGQIQLKEELCMNPVTQEFYSEIFSTSGSHQNHKTGNDVQDDFLKYPKDAA